MYNILFVSGTLAQNGTEMFMMNVLRHIDRSKYHIDFCISSNEMTPNRIEAESLGCKIFVLPSRRQGPIKSIIACWKFISANRGLYDVIHWNTGNLSSIVRFVIYKHFNIPVRIVHAHSSSAIGIHNIILHKINRIIIPYFCTHRFACSSEAAKFFYGTKMSTIINNGIDVDKFDFDTSFREEVRHEFGLNKDMLVLGHVGRFDDNKNHSFLLDVFNCISHKVSNTKLLLVGEGETFDFIKKKIKEKGLEGKVVMTGPRPDVNKIMQAMDCFVMPSKFEGLPFVLVEAQCSGLPCIISDTINPDVKLTDNLEFVSLKLTPQAWCDIILDKMNHYIQKSQSKEITLRGFSIKDSVNYLQKIYSCEI